MQPYFPKRPELTVTGVHRQDSDPLLWIDLFAFSTFIIFFQLEFLQGVPSPGKLSILPLVLSIGKNLLLFPALSLSIQRQVRLGFGEIFLRPEALALYVMLILWTVADFRAFSNGVMPWSVFTSGMQRSLILVAAVGAFALAHPSPMYRRRALYALLMAPAVYVVFNVFLWAIGLRQSGGQGALMAETQSGMASAFGLSIARVKFPLTPGINTMGVVAAIAVAVSVVFCFAVKGAYKKVALLLVAACCLGAIVLVDSRGPLLALVLFLGAWFAVRATLVKRLSSFVVFLPVALIAGLWVASVVATDTTLHLLSRTGNTAGLHAFESVSTGRSAIWAAAVTRFESFRWEAFFGYGSYSQLVSGFGTDYSLEFVTSSTRVPSLHNMYLQTVYDSGLIGLAMTIAFLWLLSRRITAAIGVDGLHGSVLPVAVLIPIVLMGATESIPTKNQPDSFWIFLGVASAVIFLLSPKVKLASPKQIGVSQVKLPAHLGG